MARFLRMPGVSADSDAAALEQWLVESGAAVKAGDAIASVETEKAVVDIEVDEDSIIHALVVDAGSTIPVGDPIAVLLEPDEEPAKGDELMSQLQVGAPAEPVEPAPSAPADVPPEEGAAQSSDISNSSPERLFASPLARRIAIENGVELSSLTGSGPRGRIVRADVEAAISNRQTPPAFAEQSNTPDVSTEGGTATPHSKLRRVIASRLQESKRNAPHFYLTRHVEVDALFALRKSINNQSPVRVSVNDLFVKASARALIDVPEMNVIWTEDAVVGFETANISVAVASERGLVTPTLRSVETMSLSTLSTSIKDAVARANQGRLQQSELEGGTLSITNLGMYGIDEFTAIINPPQAAILAIGTATKRPVVTDDGSVAAAQVVTVTLSVDHRPVDGVIAAKWLDRLVHLIREPLQLLI